MSIISQTPRSFLPRTVNLFLTQKRYNVRQSIHRHTEPHKFKKHMLAACEPYIRKEYISPEEACKVQQQINQEIGLFPMEKILMKELLEDIDKSNFILFIQYNYTKFQSERVYKNTITKLGGKFHALNNKIYREAFKTLNLEEVKDFFVARNALVTGQVESLPGCVNALKKMPQFLLLAGYIDKHIYNVDQLKQISTTTNIDQCRANLLALLDNPAVDLSYYLESHIQAIQQSEGTNQATPVEQKEDTPKE